MSQLIGRPYPPHIPAPDWGLAKTDPDELIRQLQSRQDEARAYWSAHPDEDMAAWRTAYLKAGIPEADIPQKYRALENTISGRPR